MFQILFYQPPKTLLNLNSTRESYSLFSNHQINRIGERNRLTYSTIKSTLEGHISDFGCTFRFLIILTNFVWFYRSHQALKQCLSSSYHQQIIKRLAHVKVHNSQILQPLLGLNYPTYLASTGVL